MTAETTPPEPVEDAPKATPREDASRDVEDASGEVEGTAKKAPDVESPGVEGASEKSPGGEGASDEASDVEDASEETAEGTGPGSVGHVRRLPVVLGAVAVLLGGFAFWFATEANGLRGTTAARNTALTDTARTSEVKGKVNDAVNAIFSYDYGDPSRTDQAARTLLTGNAVGQWGTMVAQVRSQAPRQKLILTTTVTDSAVELLDGDRAHLLLFADQRNTRTTTRETTYAAAMLAVDAVRRDGTWKISNIDTLNVPR